MHAIIITGLSGVLLMFFGAMNLKKMIIPTAIFFLAIALGFQISYHNQVLSYFQDSITIDNMSVTFGSLVLILSIIVIFISDHYYKGVKDPLESVYAVLVFSLVGILGLLSFGNFATFFIALEIMSISMYILTASKKTSGMSNEAAMKYFLTGTIATGILLFGITLIYGSCGSFDLHEIHNYVLAHKENLPIIFQTGLFMIIAAMCFKIAAVPFHFWTPDVYHGAPTLITAYMATVIKIASIAAFYRLLALSFSEISEIWQWPLAIISALSIIYGNVAAIFQEKIKRMLSYSSIAHSGYFLMLFLAISPSSSNHLFFYSIAYSFATLATFVVLIIVREKTKDGTILAFSGFGTQSKLATATMIVALFSLTGLPISAGFFAKYFVFYDTLQNGFTWLVVVAVVGSLISIYYYFRPIIYMLVKKSPDQEKFKLDLVSKFVLILLLIGTLLLGILPQWAQNLI